MAMTMSEKILADHAGLKQVHPGQMIRVRSDLHLVSEFPGIAAMEQFDKIKWTKQILEPEKTVVVLDHNIPNKDIVSANVVKKVREFALEQKTLFYEVGRTGIEHVLLPEQGLVRPGMLVVGADSHTCTYGALGVFSTGMGSTDIAVAWATGEVWLKVPLTTRIELTGKKRPWVSGKDLILYLIGKLGVDGANYRTLEFCGEAIGQLDIADRLTMANMVIEAGAKNGIFPVDSITEEYVRSVTDLPYTVYTSDPDAQYDRSMVIDIGEIEPQVAFPPLPSNAKPVSEAGDITFDQVVIGSCTNGRLEDLRIAAGIMKGKKVHPRLRCIVIPGTQQIYLDAVKEGLITTFIEAECVVSTPTCGPCIGGHMGILAAGEKCLSTTNRNFVGRMGDSTSEVYLASPAVAAATAICGKLSLPDQL